MTDDNRPRTPTEEEIAAVLADARANDPSGYSYSAYYYSGISDEPEADANAQARGPLDPVAIPNNIPDIFHAPEDFEGGDVAMYHHTEDNTWRAYPPAGEVGITELPELERVPGELPEVTMRRKRDRLRARGIRIIKRVKHRTVVPEGTPPKLSTLRRIGRKLTMRSLRLDGGLEWR